MENERKTIFSAKRILQGLAILCIVFVFCPSFMVSCSGQTMNISAMTAIKGIEYYGEEAVAAHPIMVVSILLPAVILVVLFAKKIAEKLSAKICIGCMAVDILVWFVFRNTAKKAAEEYYCTFKTTGFFVLNILIMLLIMVISALVIWEKISLECDVREVLMSSEAKKNIGYCTKCGTPILQDGAFCTKCGAPVQVMESEVKSELSEENITVSENNEMVR